jgi:flagellar M-ring protein FliF
MNAAQRLAFLSVALIAFGTIALLVNLGSEPSFGTLYSDLTPEDASAVVDELNSGQVPYRLTHAGTTVLVPIERVYDVRLEMAANGLPASGPVGFEIFNENTLGMTPFQQRIQLRRALEGELARTISRLSSVDWARIHINMPDRALFKRERQHPTASVVLSLQSGRVPSASEVSGVTHLVAGAVEGLDSDHVTILDARGRLLARPGGEDADALAADVLDVQRSVESKLAQRAQSLLDATLGAGKSIVTVSAAVNRKRFEETSNRVNPDESAVISEQRTEEERSTPASALGGVPGTPSNVPGGLEPEGGGGGENSTETIARETLNFDVSRSTSQTVVPMGEVTKLSVAVVVDGTYTTPPPAEGAEEEATPEAIYEPRSDEELNQLAEIVKRAVGFDQQRGDEFEIQNLRFPSPLEDVAAKPLPYWRSPEFMMLVPTVTRGVAVVGGLLLLVLLVLRPALRQLSQAQAFSTQTADGAPGAGPGGSGEETFRIADPDAELAIPVTKDQAKEVANAMRQWLRE